MRTRTAAVLSALSMAFIVQGGMIAKPLPASKPSAAASASKKSAASAAPAIEDGALYELDGKTITAKEAKGYQAYGLAMEQLQKHKDAAAKANLETAVSLFPSLPEGHFELAVLLFKLGEYKKSQLEAEKSVALKPSYGEAWHAVATGAMMSGDSERAVQGFKKFLELLPKHQLAPAARGHIKSLEEKLHGSNSTETSSLLAPSSENYLAKTISEGCMRWDKSSMPITVFIQKGAGVPGFRAEFDTAVRKAFDQWQGISDNLVSFKFVDDAKDAKITCSWTNSRKGLVSRFEGGQAEIRPNTYAKIGRATIILVTADLQGNSNVPTAYIERVALHEVGHALGLSHSDQPGDGMYEFVANNTEKSGLSARDKNTLIAFYGAEGDQLSSKVHQRTNEWDALWNSGREEFRSGNYDAAIANFKNALEVIESDKEDLLDHRRSTYSALAQAYMQKKDFPAAEASWKSSLAELRKRAPEPHKEYVEAYHMIGVCCSAQEKRAEALSFYKLELAQLDKLHMTNSSDRVKVLQLLGIANLADGNFKEALPLYAQLASLVNSGAIKDKSQSISILKHYADALQLNNRQTEAIAIDKRIKALQAAK